MWRKGSPCAVLVGMQTGAATRGNSMEVPQKIKNRTALQSSDSTSGSLSEENRTLIQKDIGTPMFTAGLFSITKTQKQPKCLSIKL